MPKKIILIAIIWIQTLPFLQAQNACSNDRVKTLTVRVKENWQIPPIIELNGNQTIEIKFDFLDLNVHYFYYSITHCNADWTPSDISESEFLDGFNNQPIEERKPSFNTYLDYTNYHFEIPNNNIKLRLSGNYMVKVYDNSNPDDVVATARFSVYEKLVGVGTTINTITDVDYNKGHQQLDLQIDTHAYPIRSPQQEMKIVVNQNSRKDNEVRLIAPTYTQGSNLIFSHVPSLIFEAGNEFRRFEMVSYRYNGLNVERIRHINPYYNVFLYRDQIRANRSYTFDQDQNGRLYIRNSEANNSDNEADYFLVHFSLAADAPFGKEKIYLMGEFSNFCIDPSCELTYDILKRAYTKDILLKQGAYNYQYVFVSDDSLKSTTAYTEGNYYETENEYTIRVYHRPPGERYDRLVGYSFVKSGK